jgi:hypothetical protein
MSWRTVLPRTAAAVTGAVLLCAGPSSAAVASEDRPEPVPIGATGTPSALSDVALSADRAAAARAEARRAEAEVRSLTGRLTTADRAYATAVTSVGRRVADSVLAQAAADDAERRAAAASAVHARSARALYVSGGQAGLVASVLRADDPQDLALRVLGLRAVMDDVRTSAERAQAVAERSAARADRAAAGADAQVVVADDLAGRAAEVEDLLRQAQATLDRLSERAGRLAEAQGAAVALAEARAQAAASRRVALAGVRATLPPSGYLPLYRSAAATCPGLRWTVLAAVGQVESGHGRNVGPSSAGALGPMQFMPATFGAYAVDGDHDGLTDPMSPADSVFTAARYLCASGGGSASGVSGALLRYNHAQWYVDLVLRVEQQLLAEQP